MMKDNDILKDFKHFHAWEKIFQSKLEDDILNIHYIRKTQRRKLNSPCLGKPSILRRVASGDMSKTVGADSGRKANRSCLSLSFFDNA